MSHPFGDLVRQHLSRKHGLSQNKLATGIDQDPAIVSGMCHGKRLYGPLARERVLAMIDWFNDQGVLHNLTEANRLLQAAQMSSLCADDPVEKHLLSQLKTSRSSSSLQITNETRRATGVLSHPQDRVTRYKRLFLSRQQIPVIFLLAIIAFSVVFFIYEGRSKHIWQVDFNNFNLSKWQEPSAFWTVTEENSAVLHENDPNLFYGKVESEQITVDATSNPVLYLQVTAVDPDASYSIQIQDAKTYEPTDVLKDITLPGEKTIDLVEAMGWQPNEKHTITINIWISGEGKSVTFSYLEISMS